MTANVALTDTFDQWRVKDNEIIIMTQPTGMNNFIKVLDTANSTSTTTGSIITQGGVGIGKSVQIGEDLKVWGDITCVGDTTVAGNLIFGDATTDQVEFEADINSDIIPNANLTFDLGNTSMHWANTFTGHLTTSQKVDSGKPALTVVALDIDQIAVDINASTVSANAVDISADAITSGTALKVQADALTTGKVMDLVSSGTITGTGLNIALDSLTSGKVVNISGDGLTTGSALYIESNSGDTSARHLVSVINNHVDADAAIPIYAKQDADAPCGQFDATTSLVIPAGTASNRGTGVQGGVRFNTEYNFFEGYTGSEWTQFGSVEDVDEDTYIRAETSPGADNDELQLVTASTERMLIGPTGAVLFSDVGSITVGANQDGHDLKVFGAGTGKYWLWDESADQMKIVGSSNQTGNAQLTGTLTVGVDNVGHDVKFFGATSGSFMLWDESDDALEFTDSSPIKVGDDADMQIYHNGSDSYITNATGELKLATETSGIVVRIGHTTSEVYTGDNLTVNGSLTEISQREMKTNISNIENILPSVLQLQGVSFDWKKDKNEKNHYGLIAEEVDKVLPNLVSHDSEGKALGIQYSKMTAVLLEALKEQQVQIEELKSKLN